MLKWKENKTLRLILLSVAALLLLLALWKVFFSSEKQDDSKAQSAEELRVGQVLEQTEGIEKASVYVTKEEEKAVSAVVVFRGEDGILVRMRILDITSSALGIKRENVQIYPASR